MNERLVEGERLLVHGLTDHAEQVFQAILADDPGNAAALVGLARIALERADDAHALDLARQARAADPANEMARRMAARLEEVAAERQSPSSPKGMARTQPGDRPSESAVFERNRSMADHRRREEDR